MIPEQVQVMLTERCNLRCKHCAVPEEDSPAETELDASTWRTFITALARGGVQSLVFSGGEALLRPDVLDLIDHAHAEGMRQTVIVSNLVFRGPGVAGEVARRQIRWPGFGLQVSIDGASPATHDWMRGKNAFRRLLDNAAAVRAAGGRIDGINTVLHRGNVHELDALVELVHSLGARNWRLFPVAAIGRGGTFAQEPLGEADWRDVLGRLPAWRARYGLDVLAMGPIFGDDWSASGCDAPLPGADAPSRCLVGPDGALFICPPMRHATLGNAARVVDVESLTGVMEDAQALQTRSCITCKFKLLCVGVDRERAIATAPERPYVSPG